VTLGSPIFDVATLEGGDNPTGTITFNAYGPDDAECTGPITDTSVVAVAGNGSYQSADFTPDQAGVYRWIAIYSGDENNAAVAGNCNDPNDSVTVTPGMVTPTLTTVASRDTYVGKEIYDTATLSGGAEPTGIIRFLLYGPDDAMCSRDPIFTTSVDVTGNGEYRSEAFRPVEAGTYQWVASYSGDANNRAVETECGDPAEQVVVKKKPYGGYHP
jgi:hypothetical protein